GHRTEKRVAVFGQIRCVDKGHLAGECGGQAAHCSKLHQNYTVTSSRASAKAWGMTMRAPERTFSRARELRRDLSLPEVLLWDQLRKHRANGLRFRRQHPIGPYILDYYCSSARLAVEVDGAHHDDLGQICHDARRDSWLAERRIRVMRIAAADI